MRGIKILTGMVLVWLAMFSVEAQTWPGGVHDPSSIVKDGDTYWVFSTGDGIYSMYSKDLITWKSGPTPFTKTEFPSWINNYVRGATDSNGNPIFHGGFWAPDIIYMNNKYYLYYSCSEWGTMTSTIGCVTNKTLDPESPDYKWEDVGFLGIWSYQPGLALNAIDPSIIRGHDGKVWMVYGSFNREGIVITELDSISGKPKTYTGNLPGRSIANSWTGGSHYGEGEGGAMVYRDGYYYLFYNKGGCCAGIASSYYMVMGRSTNPRGPFLDKEGKAMRRVSARSGGTIVMKHDDSRGQDDRYYGPGHFGMYRENGVDYVSFHYYDPNGFYPNPDVNNQGGPTLGLAKLDWGEDGWPSISMDFVEEGVYTLENQHSKKVADIQLHNPVNGASLYQYQADTIYDSQKWVFTSLGTGEYTVQNYADLNLYVEAGGANSSTIISMTDNYQGAINQKFRTVTSPLGYTYIYPSAKDFVWGLLLPTSSDYKLSLAKVSNRNIQRWKPYRFDETLQVSESSLEVEYNAGRYKNLLVESNGLWNVSNNASWINVEASGEKNDTLRITLSENESTAERKKRIYVISNGGLSESILITQKGKPTAIEDVSAKAAITIYPNPVQNDVFVNNAEHASITVYNQTGQVVDHYQFGRGEHSINVIKWQQGLYLFKITVDNNTFVKKVMKR